MHHSWLIGGAFALISGIFSGLKQFRDQLKAEEAMFAAHNAKIDAQLAQPITIISVETLRR